MTSRLLVYALAAAVAAAPISVIAQVPSYRGALPAKIAGPRKVASSPGGDLFVTDGQGRLFRLTRQGQVVGKLLDGVESVAATSEVVFAGTKGGLVQIDARTGRILRKLALGVADAPAALAFDEASGNLWVAFESGLLEARALDGTRVHQIPPGSGVYRLVGLAIDAGALWVAQDRTGSGATLHRYNATTGAPMASAPINGLRVVGGLANRLGGGLAVTDLFSGKVQFLGRDAALAGSVGEDPTGRSQRAGLAVAVNGDLVVANTNVGLERYGAGQDIPGCAGDSDCDGLPDSWELANGLDPNDPTDALADRDRDGLNSSEEYALGTSARLADSDGDGFPDGVEVAGGFDPLDPDDHKPHVLVDGPRSSDPGLVRLSATVRDPTGNRSACSVQWRQTSGTRVALKGATTAAASFVARAVGAYGFEATGSCSGIAAVPGKIEVAVNNVAPRADGGRLVTLLPGGRLDLSARYSVDANGDPLSFQWDQVLGPPVAASASGEAFGAIVDQPGYYVFRLGAMDRAGVEGASEIPVLVIGSAGAPTAVVSTPVLARAGEPVTLDASGSYRGASATFEWRQLEGPSAVLAASSERAAVTPSRPGRYAFEVSIDEAGVRSPPARIDVYAAASGGELPVARASAPAAAAVGVPVTLDGTGSSGTSGVGYEWRQVSGPAAGLTRADRAAATAVLFDRGIYEFELVVADVAGTSVPARVRVEARDRSAPAPVAVATAAAGADVGDVVQLDGRASTGAMHYRWTQVEGPWVVVEQGALGSFRPTAPGVYGFELEVDDGAVRSAPVRVNVAVF